MLHWLIYKQRLCTTRSSPLLETKGTKMKDKTVRILQQMKELCLSPCTMTHADRRAHWQSVARQRARDEAKRRASPQYGLGGV